MSAKSPVRRAARELTLEQLEAELRHERYKKSFATTLRSTIYMLDRKSVV